MGVGDGGTGIGAHSLSLPELAVCVCVGGRCVGGCEFQARFLTLTVHWHPQALTVTPISVGASGDG